MVSKMKPNYENLKERLTDMSVLASTRTPADALQYIEELEAKLEKAVDVLSDLADCVDDGCFCSEVRLAAVMDYAYITIAELTGGKDE